MGATLLLNASYEPLRVLSHRRAVVLVISGKADVVSSGVEAIHSEHLSVPIPSVIRLRYFVKVPYRTHLPLTRRNVVARDRGRCAYCGRSGDTIDHVVPRARGGQHIWTNVVTACSPCNSTKADRTLDELGWHSRVIPSAPAGWAWMLVGLPDAPDWEPWLTRDADRMTA